ncbi:hypothetical protein ACMHYJ_06265 [Castellaniella hirudinis]|uniref:hypothetical protein n=1 Tax=Castellaniella hirudinis TaxID=1144617 RepID=UPI0039C03E5D
MPNIVLINEPRYQDGVLEDLSDGMLLSLWTKPDLRQINAYVRGSIGGQGLAFSTFKDQNPVLATAMEGGLRPVAQVCRNANGQIHIEAIWPTEQEIEAERLQREHEIAEHRRQFLNDIRKPYKPKSTLKAWVRTTGDKPLPLSMTMSLVDQPIGSYEKHGSDAIQFVADGFDQPISIYGDKAYATKIIRASLSGFRVTATVITSIEKPQWLNASPTFEGIKTYPAEVEVSYHSRDST